MKKPAYLLPHVMAHNSVIINPFVRAVRRDAPFGDVGINVFFRASGARCVGFVEKQVWP